MFQSAITWDRDRGSIWNLWWRSRSYIEGKYCSKMLHFSRDCAHVQDLVHGWSYVLIFEQRDHILTYIINPTSTHDAFDFTIKLMHDSLFIKIYIVDNFWSKIHGFSIKDAWFSKFYLNQPMRELVCWQLTNGRLCSNINHQS